MLPRNLFHRCLARCRRSASDRAAWVTLAALALGLGPTSLGEAAQLTLTWTDHSGGQTAFAIERKTGPGGVYALIGHSAAGVATYVDTTVATGTTYCYRVRAFNEAGTSDYSNEACTSPPGGLELTVIRAGSGTGSVTSSPPGIDCGSDCAESYPGGSVVTLSAVAGPSSTFAGWGGGGCAGAEPCVVAGNAPVAITATFVAAGPPPDTQPPTAPTTIAASATSATQISVTWSGATDNVGVTGYRLERCQGTGCSTFVQIATATGTAFEDGDLAPSTRYRYRVRAVDAAGNLGGYSSAASATTAGTGGSSCPCTIWASSATPRVVADPDTKAVELGVKFRADRAGYITGIRFYKSSRNTGTHGGHLWTSAGTLLATVTFKGERQSGWQQANFAAPVPIVANTVYVASYYTTVGRYSADERYFATRGIDNPPLSAGAGANGVYRYGVSGFPNKTYNSSNYWVDVVFIPR